MKKIIAFALVLVLVLTLVATAFAAKPSVSVSSKFKKFTMKRGKGTTIKYSLNSGSYKRVGSTWRAFFYSMIYNKKNSSWRADYPSYYGVLRFSGKGSKKIKYTFGTCAPTGAYIHRAVAGIIQSNGSLKSTKVVTGKVTMK